MTQQLSNQNMLWEETIPGGAHWSFQMKRGSALRITDVAGGANLSALFYNMEEKLERYNMADTLKAQHTAHLTKTWGVCWLPSPGIAVAGTTPCAV
jgi:uncharacterized protein YcgI (DUF1989 family)